MSEFVVYEVGTGKVLRYGFCPETDVSYQVHSADERVLIAAIGDLGWYVDCGLLTRMPPKPTPHHVFDYTTKQWVDPRTAETEWPLVRAERDRRLLACDWTQLPDVPLATKEAWATYRQALRDITNQPDPFNIVWPQPPQ